MDKRFLDSVVTLTSQQDGSSLEACLMMTLPELVDCTKAKLYLCSVRDGKISSTTLKIDVDCCADSQIQARVSNEVITHPLANLRKSVETLEIIETDAAGEKSSSQIWFPQRLTNDEVVCLNIETHELGAEKKAVIRAITTIYTNYEKIIRRSERDKLTGLLNRNSLEHRFRMLLNQQTHQSRNTRVETEKRRFSKNHAPWLAIVDIDHFKNINDKFGHLCGDEVLLKLSQLMQDFFRQSDLLFRYGGEEFLIILEPIDEKSACQKLQKFVDFVNNAKFPLVETISISLGFTVIEENEFFHKAVSRADQALYYCKENGRNQSACFEALVKENKLTNESMSGEIDLF